MFRQNSWGRLGVMLVIGTLVLTGCVSSRGGTSDQKTPAHETAKKARPPLEVPKAFANDAAKRDFAYRAVQTKYYKEAAGLLEEIVTAAPDATSFSYLGTAEYNLKQYDKAIAAWQKAMDLEHSLAGEMLNNMGNAYRDSSKKDLAEASYRKALATEATCWTAAVNLADMLKGEGQTDEAVNVLEQALVTNPKEASLASMANRYKQSLKK